MQLEKIILQRQHYEKILQDFTLFQENSLQEKTMLMESQHIRQSPPKDNSLLTKSKILAELHEDKQNQVQSNTSIPETNVSHDNYKNDDFADLTQKTLQKQIQEAMSESLQDDKQQKASNEPQQRTIQAAYQEARQVSSNFRQNEITLTQSNIKRDLEQIRRRLIQEEQRDFEVLRQSAAKIIKKQDITLSQLEEEKQKKTKQQQQQDSSEDSSVDDQQCVKRIVAKSLQHSEMDDIVKKSISREIQTNRSYLQNSRISNCENIRKISSLSQPLTYSYVQQTLSESSQSYLKWMKGEQ